MHRALNTLENILWEAIICYFATYSHDNGDLSLDALPPVAVSVHLSGGDLHYEGPVNRQLALSVNDGLEDVEVSVQTGESPCRHTLE